MIDSRSVGVKSPVIGKDSGVAEGVAITVGLGVGVAVGVMEALGVDVGPDVGVGLGVLPEGEETKAGTSPACTTKFLVSVLVIPDASSQEMVIECGPSERGTDRL
jgi:hypothetical protein